jgi:hypothetical protein
MNKRIREWDLIHNSSTEYTDSIEQREVDMSRLNITKLPVGNTSQHVTSHDPNRASDSLIRVAPSFSFQVHMRRLSLGMGNRAAKGR